MNTQRGFTLIELMVSLVVFSFAIAGVLAVAVSMSQGYKDQRANVSAEGATRVPMDFLADAVRQASPGAPTGLIWEATQAGCTSSTAVTVTNSSSGPDALDIIYASGAVATTTAGAVTIASGSIVVTVLDSTGFSVGDHVVLSNTAQGHYMVVTGVSSTTVTVTSTCGDGTIYPYGSILIRAQHALFYVDTTNNVLMMNATPTGVVATDEAATTNQPLADGVEDMQLALAIDMTNLSSTPMTESATANGDSWLYNVAGETTPAQNTTGTLRAIRITLIAKTATPLLGNTKLFVRPAAEDHSVGTVTDNYRRRVLRTTAEVRNIGESP
jgi:prepilin-type N-terminal cleavage/methylation domain-containing protein